MNILPSYLDYFPDEIVLSQKQSIIQNQAIHFQEILKWEIILHSNLECGTKQSYNVSEYVGIKKNEVADFEKKIEVSFGLQSVISTNILTEVSQKISSSTLIEINQNSGNTFQFEAPACGSRKVLIFQQVKEFRYSISSLIKMGEYFPSPVKVYSIKQGLNNFRDFGQVLPYIKNCNCNAPTPTKTYLVNGLINTSQDGNYFFSYSYLPSQERKDTIKLFNNRIFKIPEYIILSSEVSPDSLSNFNVEYSDLPETLKYLLRDYSTSAFNIQIHTISIYSELVTENLESLRRINGGRIRTDINDPFFLLLPAAFLKIYLAYIDNNSPALSKSQDSSKRRRHPKKGFDSGFGRATTD